MCEFRVIEPADHPENVQDICIDGVNVDKPDRSLVLPQSGAAIETGTGGANTLNLPPRHPEGGLSRLVILQRVELFSQRCSLPFADARHPGPPSTTTVLCAAVFRYHTACGENQPPNWTGA